MNKEIKARWLAALRSGEYEQGVEMLQTPDGQFCCLGVLCDLHAKETGGKWYDEHGDIKYYGNADVLPVNVQVWAELPLSCGASLSVGMFSKEKELPELNDEGMTFTEIASLIEAQL